MIGYTLWADFHLANYIRVNWKSSGNLYCSHSRFFSLPSNKNDFHTYSLYCLSLRTNKFFLEDIGHISDRKTRQDREKALFRIAIETS